MRTLRIARRTAVAGLISGAAVVGLAGWALADGGVPLIAASSTSPTATTAAPANQGAGTNNVAAASNTTDGKTVVAISLKVVQTDSPTVDPTNAAVAVSSCSDCTTVAISLEGVLVAGDPTTFDPTNIALALNENCTNCQTLASAYQDVVQNGTRVRITGAGRKEIASIRHDLDSLRKSGLDIAAIQARVNSDAGEFLQVLQDDIVPIGKGASPDQTTSTTSPPSDNASPQASTTTDAPTTTMASPTTSEPPSTTTSTTVP